MTNPLLVPLLGLLAAACSSECIIPPCAFPIAAQINVTSTATHEPLTNVTVIVSGAQSDSLSCAGTCIVPGLDGNYVFDVRAPGYVSVQQSVNVTSTASSGRCPSCPTINKQTLNIALTPSR